ncbi:MULTISPECIES: ABC transporter substrate-binding protein [unclassified Pseudomonas]|uniref:ABC transporter substrate-binding protein n=1 Tax=unclassified Pseudomonas TaxID=196821 RepID=UPI001297DD32|nr:MULTISPECIES: ABC transporter substrate-binding protein [unclassified Pseudomonas]MQT42375.1 histidine ABC transporter substrate-binding protein [Pseudomonas sp. FSL R10-0765]MQT51780.1 histidine ABC transporter substrate-binding protein [Pseudomonas sp. FSL R10-2398]MQU01845.1 histidine ABC transporter substrate-binding protein [Pseudomonas sp. FSL R10-2245]MQU10263.1 histidine ABC transporter substrate-binding protein [Pseudomonas sp. FSL R10-2189]MQU36726.1 histidine ABC transporter subs
MKIYKTLLTPLLSLSVLVAAGTAQAATWCESGKPVKFAGLNWESGMLFTDLMQFVLEKGYGCKTDSLPGNSIAMENALSSNDIQVFAEEWVGRSNVWVKAEKAGKVVGVGAPVVGAVEGWYVPRYVIEGDESRKIKASAPNLKSIADLAQYASVFKDQEEPSKGRFYNCPAGWTCELDNSAMLKEYGLDNSYTNFRPGTGPALDAAVLSSYRRGEPILFYYWSPTPLLGSVDLVKLDEKPGVDKHVDIKVGVSKTFSEQAPELVAVLEKVNLPIDLLNQNLARMSKERIDSATLAKLFLKEHPEVWHAWVDEDAAKKIEAAL